MKIRGYVIERLYAEMYAEMYAGSQSCARLAVSTDSNFLRDIYPPPFCGDGNYKCTEGFEHAVICRILNQLRKVKNPSVQTKLVS